MTTLLPGDAELDQIRADLEAAALPDTCHVLSVTRVSDGAGGFTDTWGTATANVACRLDYRQGNEQASGGAVQPFSYWQLTLPHGTSITPANRIKLGTNTYNISSVTTGNSWAANVRCTVEAL